VAVAPQCRLFCFPTVFSLSLSAFEFCVQGVLMLLPSPNGDNTPVLVPARDSD